MKTILLLMVLCALPAVAEQRFFGITNADIAGPVLAKVQFVDGQGCQWVIGHGGRACQQMETVFSVGAWRIGALCTSGCFPPKGDRGCVPSDCVSSAWIEIQQDNVTLGVKFVTEKSGDKPEKVPVGHWVRRWRIIRVTNTVNGYDSKQPATTFDDAMKPTLGPNR